MAEGAKEPVDLEDDNDDEEEAELAFAVLVEQGKEVAAEGSRASGASSTHPRPRTWALTGMNFSHKTAPTNLDHKHLFCLTRQIFIQSRRLMGRITRPHCTR